MDFEEKNENFKLFSREKIVTKRSYKYIRLLFLIIPTLERKRKEK